MFKIAIIIPCYNEEAVLSNTIITLLKILEPYKGTLILADDGSSDKTWDIISDWHKKAGIIGLKLAQNYGQQEALLAALAWAEPKFDAFITIDADLQDEPKLIPKMIELFAAGHELVLAVRSSRKSDTFFKKASAAVFYRVANIGRRRLVPNHGDFRLMSRSAAQKLLARPVKKPFLRAMIMQLGIEPKLLYFARQPRTAGESKYSLKKMADLALRLCASGGRHQAAARSAHRYRIEAILAG